MSMKQTFSGPVQPSRMTWKPCAASGLKCLSARGYTITTHVPYNIISKPNPLSTAGMFFTQVTIYSSALQLFYFVINPHSARSAFIEVSSKRALMMKCLMVKTPASSRGYDPKSYHGRAAAERIRLVS